MRWEWRAVLLASLIVTAGEAQAQSPPSRVVSTGWVAESLQDPDLVLLHVGDEEEYAGAHLPGARYVALKHLSDPASLEHDSDPYLEMGSPEFLEESFEALGISDSSRIVVYWGRDWVTAATRVVLALDHAGLAARTALMDGGMPAWQEEGRPVSDVVPGPARGSLTVRPDPDLIVDRVWVSEHLEDEGVRIVDARNTVFFVPTEEGQDDRYGHIPGAVNIPFNDIVDDRLRIRPRTELQEMFRKASVQQGETIVVYCHIGQQASLVRFAAMMLGHPVRFYDGSFTEWVAHGMPVEVKPR